MKFKIFLKMEKRKLSRPRKPLYEDKNDRYLNWLKENKWIFPRLDYPAKFGEFQVIGARANCDIPP